MSSVDHDPEPEGGRPAGPEDVLTTEEAAALLRLHPQTVRRLVRQGTLPGRKLGRDLRFSRRQLMAWVEGREPPPAS